MNTVKPSISTRDIKITSLIEQLIYAADNVDWYANDNDDMML